MESTLTAHEKSYLHDSLEHMKGCRGRNCILPRSNKNQLQVGQDLEATNNNNSLVYRGGSRRRHNGAGELKDTLIS